MSNAFILQHGVELVHKARLLLGRASISCSLSPQRRQTSWNPARARTRYSCRLRQRRPRRRSPLRPGRVCEWHGLRMRRPAHLVGWSIAGWTRLRVVRRRRRWRLEVLLLLLVLLLVWARAARPRSSRWWRMRHHMGRLRTRGMEAIRTSRRECGRTMPWRRPTLVLGQMRYWRQVWAPVIQRRYHGMLIGARWSTRFSRAPAWVEVRSAMWEGGVLSLAWWTETGWRRQDRG